MNTSDICQLFNLWAMSLVHRSARVSGAINFLVT
jgi:hypothetical protein